MKTNAVRLLDESKIPYELREYKVDPSDLSAETVAAKIGLPAEQVFKTLLVRSDDGGLYFAVVPGDRELDLKAAAKAVGTRHLELAALRDLQVLTGYIRGGVTVLAARKSYPVLLDQSALLFPIISISAGVRGTQILLAPGDYVAITEARTAAISRPKA